jgi:hypothetical protein
MCPLPDFFSRCTQIVPVIGDHLLPDACRFVLELLILAALIASVTPAYFLRFKAPSLEQQPVV